MTSSSVRMRQVMDISAAVWGGVIGGLGSLIVQMIMATWLLGSSPWVIYRWIAAIILGERVLPPPADFALTPVLVGLIIHLIISILYSLLLAFMIHRWGLIVGIVGGGLFGVAVYAVNFFTLTLFFPWFFATRNWMMILAHIVFGALAGGVYEGLEVEEFVPVEE